MPSEEIAPIAPLSTREVAALRGRHAREPCPYGKGEYCPDSGCRCGRSWPCTTARLLATLEAATQAARREGFEEALEALMQQAEKHGLCADFRLAVSQVRAAYTESPRRAGEGEAG